MTQKYLVKLNLDLEELITNTQDLMGKFQTLFLESENILILQMK